LPFGRLFELIVVRHPGLFCIVWFEEMLILVFSYRTALRSC